MNKRIDGVVKCIVLLALVAIFALYAYAYFGLQTSEGVGLYINMRTGLLNRSQIDLIAVAVRLFGLGLLLFGCCAYSKRHDLYCCFRMLSLFLALMPELRFSWLLHLFDVQPMEMCFLDRLLGLTELLKYFGGFFVLLLVWKKIANIKLYKRDVCVLTLSVFFLVLGLILPQYKMLLDYACAYCLLLVGVCLLERSLQATTSSYWWLCPIVFAYTRGLHLLILMSLKN